MGVPKFFRYISERYPCLSELAREHSIPEFDNLYLDMNGIVHNCSHPDDNNIHFHIEEEQILQDIFNYVEKLFYLIKPQRLFFLAVDGVAPRAKMNQQRSRRFRSAREAEQLEAKAKQRGEQRAHERFDSNCITPGTAFMQRLQRGLRAFIQLKVSTDTLWRRCRVILSGQETPGEGEHKIMDYIRFLKSESGYDPNTRHCLYGLDADLIILGLCTHELHFVVLREEVKFGRNVKRTSVEETRFFLLHLGLLREYLELEFHGLNTAVRRLDVAQLIDDWVLMGFMVGNDFIPHLPCLHISSNALPLLYRTYIKIYPKLGGNINEAGKLNLQRLQIFFTALSEVELELFKEHADDLKYMNAKTEAFDLDVSEITRPDSCDTDLAALINKSMEMFENDSTEDWDDEEACQMQEFQNYKGNYYRNKFKCSDPNDLIEILTQHYVTALQWVLDYYYRGVQSWDWYYPFHYAPFISDLKNVAGVKVKFQMGSPFLPFQQLLAVLPAASSKLLPVPYHDLMLNPKSPLAEFYPVEFESDLNGKKHDWEAVVLIPFIDESRLLKAMEPCEALLSEAERERNRHGPMYQYEYTEQSQGTLLAHPPLRALPHLYCTEIAKWSYEIALNLAYTVCVELPNAARHVFFPGFPTMQHLPFDFELRHDRVKVFEQVSRNQNMVLLPRKSQLEDTLEAVAGKFLEQIVYIGWPHLTKAKVIQVATRNQKVDKEGLSANEPRRFDIDRKSLQEHFSTRMGIEFPNYDVLVYVCPFAGSTIEFGSKGEIYTRDAWSKILTAYPSQGVVTNLAVQENMRQQFNKIDELFPVNSPVFFIGKPYFGSEGTVLDPQLVYSCGRIKVNLRVQQEPNVQAARLFQEDRDRDFVNTYEACRQLKINGRALGRITGTILVVLGPRREKMENVAKHNIGLQLKYPRQNEERAGYCCRSGNQWLYSSLALELIREYCENFTEVVHFFSANNDRFDYIFEQDIYPDAVGERHIETVANWVRQQSHIKVERVACGSKTVCRETVQLLLAAVDELNSFPVRDVKMQVKPHLLLKPNITLPDVYRSRRPVQLFDRVIVVRTTYMVPVGIKGTVIGVHPVSDPNPVRLECVSAIDTFCEVLFDMPVPNFNDIHGIAADRVYKVPESALIVIYTNDIKKKTISDQLVRPGFQSKCQNEMSCSRYVTAAASEFNQITMKSNMPYDFFKPGSSPSPTSDKNRSEKRPEKQKPTDRWRESSNKQSYTTDNWVNQVNSVPPPNRSQSKKVSMEAKRQNTPRQQDEKSFAADISKEKILPAEPISIGTSPHAQTLALMSLLGLKNRQNEAKQAQPISGLMGQPPSPGEMRNFPKPPLFWQQEAQEQQKTQIEGRIQTQQWDRIPQPIDAVKQRHQTVSSLDNANFPARSTYNNNFGSPMNQNHYQQLGQTYPQIPQEVIKAPRQSSVKDFVPIQAYRPKK
ncbi:hypothetical protein KR018_007499, partial [Drosophila ironensis]